MSEFENELACMDIFEDYTPLDRPPRLSEVTSVQASNVNIDSDDSDNSSSSSSSTLFLKHLNKRSRNSSVSQDDAESRKRSRKYEGWVQCAHEDVALEFVNMSVKGNRNLEWYDYRLKENIAKGANQPNGTNKMEKPKNDFVENGSRQNEQHSLQKPRFLPPLFFRRESVKMLVERISYSLRENNSEIIDKIVRLFGKKVALKLYNDTRNVEINGGMLTSKENRRRTSGGIFILLAKEMCDMNKEEHRSIFKSANKVEKEKKKMKRKRNKGKKKNGNKFIVRHSLQSKTSVTDDKSEVSSSRCSNDLVLQPDVECLQPNVDCLQPDVDCLLSNVDCLQPDVDCLLSNVDCLQPDVDCLQPDVDCLQPDVECLQQVIPGKSST